ncbi:MAG: glycosyltransferase [Spirulinaceae cyanobacterium]
MMHYGIVCPAVPGHLNPSLSLGKALQKHGHRVTFITILDAQSKIEALGLETQIMGRDLFPKGSLKKRLNLLGEYRGLTAFKYTIKLFQEAGIICFRDMPKIIEEAGIEALILDQGTFEGPTIAEFMNLPFITLCNALMIHAEPAIPPFNLSWQYNPSWFGCWRNQLAYTLTTQVFKPIRKTINQYRQQWHLPLYSHPNDANSPLAQISQQPAAFEFPRKKLPLCFHFTGPYHYSSAREPVPFPWEKLTGKPLIYASMGTLQNRLLYVFEIIAEACQKLDAQLVISLGSSTPSEALPQLAGNPIVVNYAPQLELLQKASLTITHAGLNTTLESLTNGVPLVAIPVTNDQPGVAARIVWTGVGEQISLKALNPEKLRRLVQKVLTESSYKENAVRLQKAIQASGGVEQAVDIIEQAVRTNQPVLRKL